VTEIALAMILLTGAGLLLRSFALLQRVDPGVRADHLLTFTVRLPRSDETFFPRSIERMRALPGVRSAALVSQLPVSGRGVWRSMSSVMKAASGLSRRCGLPLPKWPLLWRACSRV